MDHEFITISELNNYIKGLLDDDIFLNKVYIKGEISNFKITYKEDYDIFKLIVDSTKKGK